jgi:hypothetical protein
MYFVGFGDTKPASYTATALTLGRGTPAPYDGVAETVLTEQKCQERPKHSDTDTHDILIANGFLPVPVSPSQYNTQYLYTYHTK